MALTNFGRNSPPTENNNTNQFGTGNYLSSNVNKPTLLRKRSTESPRYVKVLVLGSQGVGKSAITVRFLTKRFIGEYDQNLESKQSAQVMVDSELVTFEILDTVTKVQDQEPFYNLPEEHIKWADGCLLVFDVTNKKSLEMCCDLKERISELRKNGPSIPLVLVGNKADLTHTREITTEEGENKSSLLGCPYIEISASEDYLQVHDAFLTLYKEVKTSKRPSRTFFDKIFRLSKE